MLDTTGHIAIAQIAFFAITFPPSLYCLFKHGKHGLLGWFFLLAFCAIRVVGAGIVIHDENTTGHVTEVGGIITSVAVAPLILAIAGIFQESTLSIEHYQPTLFRWIPHVVHLIVLAAIALLVVGFTSFEGEGKTLEQMKTGLNEVRGGGAILLIVWILLFGVVFISFKYPRVFKGEKILIVGVAAALGSLLLRILYTFLGAIINSSSWSVSGGTLVEKLLLDVLPEFLLTLTLIAVGFLSRNLARERREVEESGRNMKV